MSQYSKDSLELLREKVDLIELLSTYMPLKRSGATYKGLCPFHEERTPSFLVRAGDSHYHCFGCGAHGDAIAFLMSHLKLPFNEAVDLLAERFGVTLRKVEGGEASGPSKSQMRDVLEMAAEFYHFYLLYSEEGRVALDYLYRRGLDLNFIRLFRIGLAPSQPGVFQAAMREKRADPKLMEIVGLIKERRDFFIHRILFPITDSMEHVIGFSGRKMRDEAPGPKYINTPETPLFKKSKVLFGLSHSRKRIAKERRAIVVEGQIDALRLIEVGFNIAVAGQGTAFGESHAAELIALGVQTIYLALDGDGAGQEATVKIGDLFQRAGIDVFVAQLPEKSDPDSFLREHGPEAFQKLLDDAIDYLSFLVEHYSKGQSVQSPAKKNQLVLKIAAQIRAWEHPLMVHESLRKLAQLTHVPETVIQQEPSERPDVFIKKSGSITQQEIDPDRILEADLLRWLFLVGKTLIPIAQLNLKPEHFRTAVGRRIYKLILDAYEAGETIDLLGIAAKLDNVEDQLFLSEILQRRVNVEKALEGMIETVRKMLVRHWMERREEIKMRIQTGRLKESELAELAKEFDRLKGAPPNVEVPKSEAETSDSL